jgi:hypothetical protein
MSVSLTPDGVVELSGRCSAEDAEALQRLLLTTPGNTVEWGACMQLHAAVLQVLLTAKPRLTGEPQDEFIKTYIAPLLQSPDT